MNASGGRCSRCGGSCPEKGPCGCCEGVRPITPVALWNPAGLSAIRYRVGSYGQFRETMLSSLSGFPALSALTTRADDDLAVGILDSFAAIGDVLSFYQERIANEGFLRTATERLSLLQLAREIGYELGPGVAASAYLAFTLDTSGSVSSTLIDIGTKVQSVPLQGKTPPELPQTFETIEPIVAYPEVNSMKPNQSAPQVVVQGGGGPQYWINGQSYDKLQSIVLKGTSTKLKVGDKLLFLAAPEGGSKAPLLLATVTNVSPQPESSTTQVSVSVDTTQAGFSPSPASPPTSPNPPPSSSSLASTDMLVDLDAGTLSDLASRATSESDLKAILSEKGWDPREFAAAANSIANKIAPPQGVEVYALRVMAGIFGDAAPPYVPSPSTSPVTFVANSWSSWPIDEKSDESPYLSGGERIFLDATHPTILPGSWVVISSGQNVCATDVEAVGQQSLSDFGISAKATGLDLDLNQGALSGFHISDTTVFAQSEQLQFAPVPPVPSSLQSDSIALDQIYPTLQKDQTVIVTGELVNQPGNLASEVVSITEMLPIDPNTLKTTIDVGPQLTNSYVLDTVTINGNVALSTHGETKNEVVGSGDPTRPYLEFALKQEPLTFVRLIPPASSPSGSATTLRVWVDGIRWSEAPSLYELAPDSRTYVTRRDDDGTVNVIFGNACPPVGVENITAQYRVGTGLVGMVKAGQLSLLVSRPLGVQGVTNPLPADGAGDPEDRDHAREHAPITVLTLDRIVSLTDVQNFALAFPGIGKALAQWSWTGDKKSVTLFVASSTGEAVVSGSTLHSSLRKAIDDYKDPSLEIRIDESFKELLFNIHGWVLVEGDRDPNRVEQAVVLALQQAFSFEARQLGEPVHLSDVLGVIQAVGGVVATDIDQLYVPGQPAQSIDIPLTCGFDQILAINPGPDGISLDVRVPS